MKFIIRVVFIFCAASLSIKGQGFTQENPRQLNVSAMSQLEIPADRIYVDFSVTGYGPTLRKAVDNAALKTDIIATKLLSLGLSKGSLSTSSFTSGENVNGKAFLSSSKDFRAVMNIRITLDTLKLISDIVFCLSESDISDISNLRYVLKDYNDAKTKAREQAINNANEKAKQMADLGGFTIKRVLYMSEDRPLIAKDMASSIAYMDSAPTYKAFFEKTITVSSYAYIIYEIE